MPAIKHNHSSAQKRKNRVRAKLHGTKSRPRLSIFRSNRFVYLQAIDDDAAKTMVGIGDRAVRRELTKANRLTKSQTASQVATQLAKRLRSLKVKAVILDRGPYRYHGRVKAVAEAIRKEGITL